MRVVFRWLVVTLLALAPTGPALADAGLGVDLESLGLTLATDGRGGYVAFRQQSHAQGKRSPALAYVGDGKVFYEVPLRGSLGLGSRGFFLDFDDPRFHSKQNGAYWNELSDVGLLDGRILVRCGKKGHADGLPLAQVDATNTQRILKKARVKSLDRRRPYALARDASGTYYYVDQSRVDGRDKDLHLYVGRRGNMRRLKLKDVIADSASTVLSSTRGTLSLGPELSWSHKRKKTELVSMEIDKPATTAFIYGELGVYVGKKLGTPCDLF